MARSTKTAREVLTEALPGRVSVQMGYYDKGPRSFRPVPGFGLYAQVETAEEAALLRLELELVISRGKWRRVKRGRGAADAGRPGAVRPVATAQSLKA